MLSVPCITKLTVSNKSDSHRELYCGDVNKLTSFRAIQCDYQQQHSKVGTVFTLMRATSNLVRIIYISDNLKYNNGLNSGRKLKIGGVV